ncbi:hypothetical protein JW921_00530 [Candidatus Fermentibacterales bacterium]|nr:hypothetical protein [Candidatus Fermentibacterales bacterium]
MTGDDARSCMGMREFDPGRDSADVQRIWREVGWLEPGKEEVMEVFLSSTSCALVGTIDDRAESLSISCPAVLRYLDGDLPMTAVTGVTTGLVARRQGLAMRVTAELVAREAQRGGFALAGLGMFEQGYYDRLGFGTGGYQRWVSFDPARLRVPGGRPSALPARLGADDWREVHACRLSRMRGHGACSLLPPEATRAEMMWGRNAGGLGFRDGAGTLTHFLWMTSREPEHGPFEVPCMAYRSYDDLRDLLWLLSGLREQVDLIHVCEPAGIQLQDILASPMRTWRTTRRTRLEQGTVGIAYFQFRVLDLRACVGAAHLTGCSGIRFNLELHDPLEAHLDVDSTGWRGCSGDFTVGLGSESALSKGHTRGLPLLRSSVNAFTRMWMGTLPASGLAVTDDLVGPPGLLRELDAALLPARDPRPDWDF